MANTAQITIVKSTMEAVSTTASILDQRPSIALAIMVTRCLARRALQSITALPITGVAIRIASLMARWFRIAHAMADIVCRITQYAMLLTTASNTTAGASMYAITRGQALINVAAMQNMH